MLDKIMGNRKHWKTTVANVLWETKTELLLVTAVAVHEVVFWSIYHKEKELLEKAKNLEYSRQLLAKKGIEFSYF